MSQNRTSARYDSSAEINDELSPAPQSAGLEQLVSLLFKILVNPINP